MALALAGPTQISVEEAGGGWAESRQVGALSLKAHAGAGFGAIRKRSAGVPGPLAGAAEMINKNARSQSRAMGVFPYRQWRRDVQIT